MRTENCVSDRGNEGAGKRKMSDSARVDCLSGQGRTQGTPREVVAHMAWRIYSQEPEGRQICAD